MNFSDAIPLAKSNPGSVIKRSGDYGFIVVSDSGKVISDADIDPSMYANAEAGELGRPDKLCQRALLCSLCHLRRLLTKDPG